MTTVESDSVLKSTEHEIPPPTLEVLRKYDDIEYRRRSATLRVDSACASVDSRQSNSSHRTRDSGVNRLLRSDDGHSTDHWSSCESIGSSVILSAPVSSEATSCTEWSHVVLKMNSFSDEDLVTSFRFGIHGGTIGRLSSTNPSEQMIAAIPADKTMAETSHARILYHHGRFYLVNGNPENSGTSIRLSPITSESSEEDKMQWPLDVNAIFRAGKSDYKVTLLDETIPSLHIVVLSGKLGGQTFVIGMEGGGIGRSAENIIHTNDGELSRHHCRIWYDPITTHFYLIDINSTNGTFMRLIGPYDEPYRLEIGDDLLLSQTCLTVHRFDYGVSATMGARKQMEDAHTIVQDLNIPVLTRLQYYPQSFFGVFDGHGGAEASSYVNEVLHHNIVDRFQTKQSLLESESSDTILERIQEQLIEAFEQTDRDFLLHSKRPQAGSTATTVFIAGKYAFVINVGDSRTILSRCGMAIRLSNDHKPSRPDEAQRIRDTGGFIIHGRIMGELAVSRAFGDSPFKTFEIPIEKEMNTTHELPVHEILKGPLVIPTPEITQTLLTDDEEFFVLASDGLFDVLNDQQVINFLRQKMIELGDVQRAVEAIVEDAITNQRSMDNITVIVIMLKEIRELQT